MPLRSSGEPPSTASRWAFSLLRKIPFAGLSVQIALGRQVIHCQRYPEHILPSLCHIVHIFFLLIHWLMILSMCIVRSSWGWLNWAGPTFTIVQMFYWKINIWLLWASVNSIRTVVWELTAIKHREANTEDWDLHLLRFEFKRIRWLFAPGLITQTEAMVLFIGHFSGIANQRQPNTCMIEGIISSHRHSTILKTKTKNKWITPQKHTI